MARDLSDQSDTYVPRFPVDAHSDLLPAAEMGAVLRALCEIADRMRLDALRLTAYSAFRSFSRDRAMRELAQETFDRALRGYDASAALIDPKRWETLHPVAKEILGAVVPTLRGLPRTLPFVREHSLALHEALCEDRLTDEADRLLRHAFTAHVPALIEFDDAVAREVETRRKARRAAAADATRRAQDARAEIAGMARTVRMISINARVEAARAGDHGRAFALIAEEIGHISERAQRASTEMGRSIDDILGETDAP